MGVALKRCQICRLPFFTAGRYCGKHELDEIDRWYGWRVRQIENWYPDADARVTNALIHAGFTAEQAAWSRPEEIVADVRGIGATSVPLLESCDQRYLLAGVAF